MSDSKKQASSPAQYAADINASLIANINHALRTPLNGMVGMMELLSKTGLNESQNKYAHVIRESTENLMLQLDNIMEIAKIEDGELILNAETVRLDDIVKMAVQPLIPAAVKKNIPISIEYAHDVPEFITTDKNRLRLILTNLLSCSLKFAERGKVVLKITKHVLQDENNPENERTQIRFLLENSKALYDALHHNDIEIADGLIGNALEEFGEITVSLLTTQKILAAMGVYLQYDNKQGNEPPFYFNIDCDDVAGIEVDSPHSVLKGKRALIFQEDVLDFNILTQSLRLWDVDYRVIDDEDQLTADMDNAHREGRPYHLFFCNHIIQGHTLAAIKTKISDIILINEDSDFSKAFLDEFSACLRPPLYPEELLSTLSSLYLENAPDYEATMSSDASRLIDGKTYEKLNATVMVVEDDFVSRLYAAELLEGLGCTVSMAENGQDALTRLEKNADYDLIFMDCMMPRLDGYNATQNLRQSGLKDIPIIALTANTLERDKEKCLAAGMNDYITKPVKESDLHAMLKKHIKPRTSR